MNAMLLDLPENILAVCEQYQARIDTLTRERDDYRDDALRLHREKCDAIDRALVAEVREAKLRARLEDAQRLLSDARDLIPEHEGERDGDCSYNFGAGTWRHGPSCIFTNIDAALAETRDDA